MVDAAPSALRHVVCIEARLPACSTRSPGRRGAPGPRVHRRRRARSDLEPPVSPRRPRRGAPAFGRAGSVGARVARYERSRARDVARRGTNLAEPSRQRGARRRRGLERRRRLSEAPTGRRRSPIAGRARRGDISHLDVGVAIVRSSRGRWRRQRARRLSRLRVATHLDGSTGGLGRRAADAAPVERHVVNALLAPTRDLARRSACTRIRMRQLLRPTAARARARTWRVDRRAGCSAWPPSPPPAVGDPATCGCRRRPGVRARARGTPDLVGQAAAADARRGARLHGGRERATPRADDFRPSPASRQLGLARRAPIAQAAPPRRRKTSRTRGGRATRRTAPRRRALEPAILVTLSRSEGEPASGADHRGTPPSAVAARARWRRSFPAPRRTAARPCRHSEEAVGERWRRRAGGVTKSCFARARCMAARAAAHADRAAGGASGAAGRGERVPRGSSSPIAPPRGRRFVDGRGAIAKKKLGPVALASFFVAGASALAPPRRRRRRSHRLLTPRMRLPAVRGLFAAWPATATPAVRWWARRRAAYPSRR